MTWWYNNILSSWRCVYVIFHCLGSGTLNEIALFSLEQYCPLTLPMYPPTPRTHSPTHLTLQPYSGKHTINCSHTFLFSVTKLSLHPSDTLTILYAQWSNITHRLINTSRSLSHHGVYLHMEVVTRCMGSVFADHAITCIPIMIELMVPSSSFVTAENESSTDINHLYFISVFSLWFAGSNHRADHTVGFQLHSDVIWIKFLWHADAITGCYHTYLSISALPINLSLTFHKNTRSCAENECCCPRTVNISNVNFTSKISISALPT